MTRDEDGAASAIDMQHVGVVEFHEQDMNAVLSGLDSVVQKGGADADAHRLQLQRTRTPIRTSPESCSKRGAMASTAVATLN